MKKPHGHYCRICQQYRANEKFSGRGHAAHICKDCHRRGNKPPEVKPEPLQFVDESSYLYALRGDEFFDELDGYPIPLYEGEQPKPKKKRKPSKEKLIRASQKQQAKGFLRRILADGDVSAVEIHERAAKAGLPKDALRRAKGSLRIAAVATENGSVWRLPITGNKEETIMARATTKAELMAAANGQWGKLWTMIDAIPGGAQSVLFDFGGDPKLKEAHWGRDKNMRDVLIHLYEWHQLLLDWVNINIKGGNKPFLPEPYTWKTYGDMNVGFWEKHQNTSYDEAVTLLRDSHAKVMALIESLSDEELFDKKHFAWTGTTNVGSYCISAVPSHYEWAMKKIKQQNKMTK